MISALLPAALAFSQTVANTPVVICPGFVNDQTDYREPTQVLQQRGFDPNLIFTVPIQRNDWSRVAAGLLDVNFYRHQALPTGKGYGWYLQRFRDTIDQAYTKANNRVLVLGHSAGGWLARAGMGNGQWNNPGAGKAQRTSDRICGLVTMGAVQRPPRNVKNCVTRGALAYTNRVYPGAYLKEEGVGYVSVGGDAIVGDDEKEPPRTRRRCGCASRLAYASYEALSGIGRVTGDGIVPLEWTQLEGAKNLQLEGVIHSCHGTTASQASSNLNGWYGSEGVIDHWLPTALKEAGISAMEGCTREMSANDAIGWLGGSGPRRMSCFY